MFNFPAQNFPSVSSFSPSQTGLVNIIIVDGNGQACWPAPVPQGQFCQPPQAQFPPQFPPPRRHCPPPGLPPVVCMPQPEPQPPVCTPQPQPCPPPPVCQPQPQPEPQPCPPTPGQCAPPAPRPQDCILANTADLMALFTLKDNCGKNLVDLDNDNNLSQTELTAFANKNNCNAQLAGSVRAARFLAAPSQFHYFSDHSGNGTAINRSDILTVVNLDGNGNTVSVADMIESSKKLGYFSNC